MPLSAKEVAIQLDTDARTLRKFLRDITDADEQPGQGGRWLIEKKDVKGLKKRFSDWKPSTSTPKSKRSKTADVEVDEVEDLEEIELDDEDEEPSDDDLEDIEDEDEEEDDEDIEEV